MLNQILKQVREDRIRADIAALVGVRHRTSAPKALEAAAVHIEDELGTLRYKLESPQFDFMSGKFRNIIATVEGKTEPDKRVMVVAHYDTIATSPGADDNASGVGVLLELARVLDGRNFDKTVQLIAVNLEENQTGGSLTSGGLVGSGELVKTAKSEGWKIEGAIVLESVAFAGDTVAQDTKALPIPGLPAVGDFIGIAGNTDSKALAEGFEQAVTDNGIALKTFSFIVPGDGSAMPDVRRSDHARFWDANYKAIMLTDTANFRNKNYHKPTDTIDTLNLEFATKVCCGVAAHVAVLAGLRE